MNQVEVQRRIYNTLAGLVLLSAILLMAAIPGVIGDNSAGAKPGIAATAIFVMMILHLLVLVGFIKNIRVNNQGSKVNDGWSVLLRVVLVFFGFLIKDRLTNKDDKVNNGLNLILGIALIFLGFIIMDGAFAFLDKLLFVSVIMFASTFIDFIAALTTFGAMFLLRKRGN